MRVTWVETTRDAYAAIYSAHRNQMQVHGTISQPDGGHYGERRMMTEWGLPGADVPIIKHDERAGSHFFYLACIKDEE